jgi:hypothetical protein
MRFHERILRRKVGLRSIQQQIPPWLLQRHWDFAEEIQQYHGLELESLRFAYSVYKLMIEELPPVGRRRIMREHHRAL